MPFSNVKRNKAPFKPSVLIESKYDEFLLSQDKTPRDFFRNHYGFPEKFIKSGRFSIKCRGWAKKKIEWLESKRGETAARVEASNPELAKQVEITVENLAKTENLIYNTISFYITQNMKKVKDPDGKEKVTIDFGKVKMSDLEIAWRMARIGQGKKTAISQNENINFTLEDLIKSLNSGGDILK